MCKIDKTKGLKVNLKTITNIFLNYPLLSFIILLKRNFIFLSQKYQAIGYIKRNIMRIMKIVIIELI
jgi:hypothetical protein